MGIETLLTVPLCNVIVGPGNKWVTTAKSAMSGHCRIDMLAGPNEVLVIVDGTPDAVTVDADVIARTKHSIVVRVRLVTMDSRV